MIKRIVIALVMVLSLVMLTNAAFSATPAKVIAKAPAVSKAVEVPAPAAEKTTLEKALANEYVQNTIAIIIGLIFSGLGLIGKRFHELTDKKIELVNSELGRKVLHYGFDKLTGIADRIFNNERKDLEAKLASGEITKTSFSKELRELGNNAIEETKSEFGIQNLQQLKNEYPDFEKRFAKFLSEYVDSKKQPSPTSSSATPPTASEPATPSTEKAA